MDVKFINETDNRGAYDATAIDEIGELVGMPAGSIREWFVRIGNVSGTTLENLSIVVTGEHPSRLQLHLS
jgi:hypothetical protein